VGKGNEVLVDIEVGKNSTGKQVLAKSEEAAGKGTEGADPSCCAPGLKLWVPLLAVLFVGGVVAVVCVLLIPGARGSHPPAPPGPQDANFQGTDSAPPPAGVDSGASLPTDSRDNSALPESDNTSPPAEGEAWTGCVTSCRIIHCSYSLFADIHIYCLFPSPPKVLHSRIAR